MKFTYATLAASLFLTFPASASIPEGFESFFVAQPTNTIVSFDGDEASISTILSFEQYKLDTSGAKQLTEFLKGKVKPAYIDSLVSNLQKGVTYEDACKGITYEQCVFMPDDIALIYDYSTKRAKVLVHPKGLEEVHTAGRYDDGVSEQNALINSMKLDTSYDSETSTESFVYGESVLGLRYGYLSAEYEISEQSELSNVSYRLDQPGDYLVTDYARDGARQTPSFGLFPSTTLDSETYSIALSTSDSLRLDKADNGRALNAFSPVNGTMRIYKDDRLVLSKNVNSGFTKVPYSSLPRGVYEVAIEIREGSEVVSTYNTQVYNFVSGKTDENVSVTLSYVDREVPTNLEEISKKVGEEAIVEDYYDDALFLESEYTFPMIDATRFGLYALVTDQRGYGIGSGIEYIQDSFSLVGAMKVYDDSSFQLSTGLNWNAFNLSYTQVKHKSFYGSSLSTSRLIHGSADESLLSLNYFARLNAQTYFNAVLSSSSYNGYKYISANSEISYTLANDWEVTVGGGYNRAESEEGFILRTDSNDEFSVSLKLSIPFSRHWGFESSNTFQETNTTSRNEIQYSGDVVDSAAVHVNLEEGEQTDVGAYVADSFKNKYVDLDYRGDIDRESLSTNAFVSNTQVFTPDGIFLTSEPRKSYIVEQPNVLNAGEENSDHIIGTSRLSHNGYSENTVREKAGDYVIGLQPYTQYEHQFMPNSLDYLLAEESLVVADYFSLPGSFGYVKPNLVRVSSNMVKLAEGKNQLVESAKCISETCYDAQEIAPGVYNIKHSGELMLLSNNQSLCSVEVDNSTSRANGHCFPETDPLSEFSMGEEDYIMISVILPTDREIKSNIEATFGSDALFKSMSNDIEVAYVAKSQASQHVVQQFKANNQDLVLSLRNAYEEIINEETEYAQQ